MQLLLQWHITGQCNLQCGHCYQDGLQEPGPGRPERAPAETASARMAEKRTRIDIPICDDGN